MKEEIVMILTYEQLTSITRGADHTRIDSRGHIALCRCTDAQVAAYGNDGAKCHLTAGIRFDFYTDSEEIAFDYCIRRRASVRWMSVDLYVDGVMVVGDYKNTHQSYDTYTFTHHFGDKARRRITIYLPYMVDIRIMEFRLDDGAEVTPYTAYSGAMLCFGDSITHGYHAHYSSCTYPAMVSRFFNYDFSNQGNAGYIFDANTIDPEQNFEPDLITVAFGTNDWSKLPSNEEYVSRAQTFFDRLAEAYPGVPVYGILPLWREDDWRPKPTGAFADTRRQLAEIMAAHGCIIVDGMKAVPHVPEFFADYRLHPNDLGFAFYAQEMIRVINEQQK